MKNMTPLDYILGEKRVRDALNKEMEDQRKEIKAQQNKDRKNKELTDK